MRKEELQIGQRTKLPNTGMSIQLHGGNFSWQTPKDDDGGKDNVDNGYNHEKLDLDNVKTENKSCDYEAMDDGCSSIDSSRQGSKSEAFSLRSITFNVPEGSLVCVIGSVGCGKSSLLSALLGEMPVTSNNDIGQKKYENDDDVNVQTHEKTIISPLRIDPSIAYVAQQPWIQNASLRDNITFHSAFDASKYARVVQACALEPDLRLMAAGDATEIGEKGINLSGGQKARVALARAAYADANLYLLDDPLSAVDAHVGKHIVDELLGPQGLLKAKTRVLVTHSVSVLPLADRIVVLDEGRVQEEGTYADLMANPESALNRMMEEGDEEEEEDVLDDNRQSGVFLTVDNHPEERRRGRQESEASVVSRRSRKESLSKSLKSKRSRQDSERSVASRRSTPERRMSRSSVTSKMPDNDDVEKERRVAAGAHLTEEETTGKGNLSLDVFGFWARLMTWKSVTFGTLLLFCYQAVEIGASFWLSRWTDPQRVETDAGNGSLWTPAELAADFQFHAGVYVALGILNGVFSVSSSLILVIGSVIAGEAVHGRLCGRILAAPMAFFDTTPLGRITNRSVFRKKTREKEREIRINRKEIEEVKEEEEEKEKEKEKKKNKKK